jgi:hypothetical protein
MRTATFLVLLRRALLVAAASPLAACGGNNDTPPACFDRPDAALTAKQTCGVTAGDCLLDDATCQRVCGAQTYCAQEKGDPTTIDCSVCGGRATAGLARPEPRGQRSRVAALFARMAHLERASVVAFEVLHDELAAHGAPRRLLRAARRARHDEARHGRVIGALAARFGGVVDDVHVAAGPVRSLEAIATENAAEGCVRETYGALVAAWQAERAGDPGVRKAMSRIARDEARHAAFSWQLAAWLEARLDASARARVRAARDAAVTALACAVAASPADAETERTCGVPRASEATRIVDTLHAELWAA